jgi:hypothetical protein
MHVEGMRFARIYLSELRRRNSEAPYDLDVPDLDGVACLRIANTGKHTLSNPFFWVIGKQCTCEVGSIFR